MNYDKENIADSNLKAVQPYLDDPEFEPDFIRAKSAAAAGICAWAINIIRFYHVFCDVEPKRQALAAANAELAAAEEKLAKIKAKIAELDDNLAELTASFEKVMTELYERVSQSCCSAHKFAFRHGAKKVSRFYCLSFWQAVASIH